MRICAVDWSGAVRGQHRTIWTAAVLDGAVESLEAGRTRTELVRHLVQLADRDSNLVVGLDFAFSFPAWFLLERALGTAADLWMLALREGEQWLEDCSPPFWGRAGRTCPLPADRQFRATEKSVPRIGSSAPQSVFKINGPGSVGTGSIRGMPFLRDLKAAGFSIWPFDHVSLPMVIEIYPRVLTEAVKKSDLQARIAYFAHGAWQVSADFLWLAHSSEDAFDALVSALVMDRCSQELRMLAQSIDRQTMLEGQIWLPSALGVSARLPTRPSRGRPPRAGCATRS